MKKVIYLILSVLAVAACKDLEFNNTLFDLEDNIVEVTVDGGDYDVHYTLSGTPGDGNFKWSASDGWMEVKSISDGKIVLGVSANDAFDSREGTVDVTYMPVGLQKTINVIQSGKNGGNGSFAISADKLFANSSYLSIVPRNMRSNYVVANLSKAVYDELGSDKEIFEYIMKEYVEAAEMHGMNLIDYLFHSGAMKKGEYTAFFDWLDVHSEYNAVVVGISQNGTMSTPLSVFGYSTESHDLSDVTFDVKADVQLPNAVLTIEPSDNNAYYYYTCVLKNDFEKEGVSVEAFIQNKIYDEMRLFGLSSQNFNPVVIAKKGVTNPRVANLLASSEYIVFVCSLDERAVVDSEVATLEFATEAVEPSDNVITITVDNITKLSAEYHVRTTNDDPYVCVCVKKDEVDGKTEDEVLEYIGANYSLKGYTYKGDLDEFIEPLDEAEDYVFIAFGYFAGVRTTDMVFEYFRTEGGSNPEDLTFEYNVTNIESFCADIEISGTPASAYYFWDVVTADLNGDDVKRLVDDVVESWIDYGWYEDRAEYMRKFRSIGRESVTYDGLDQKTSYKVFAFGIYEDTGDYATEVQFSDPFETPERVVSSAKVELSMDKYFDGAELRSIFPDLPGEADGMAIVPVTVTPSGDYAHFYASFLPSIYYDELGESKLISTLVQNGNVDETRMNCMCSYDAEYVFVAIAQDGNGDYGEIFTLRATFTREGVSPVDEFPDNSRLSSSSHKQETQALSVEKSRKHMASL